MAASIKLKTGLPIAILAVIILTLAATGFFTLSQSQSHTQKLISWFGESGEITSLNQSFNDLLLPLITLTLGQEFENNGAIKENIKQSLRRIQDQVAGLANEEGLTEDETLLVELLESQISDISEIAQDIVNLNLPYEHSNGMLLINKLISQHIKPIHRQTRSWHEEDLQRFQKQDETFNQKIELYLAISGALALLSVLMIFYAGWSTSTHVIKPILNIKQSTEELANGNLKLNIPIKYRDEIGLLAANINFMANTLDKMTNKLNEIARTDDLTGLLNRRSCDELLDQHFSAGSRYDQIFSLIMLDIDHFKTTNDRFGHPAGDEVLKVISQVAQKSIRDCDYLFRYGGEEFLILLPNTDKNDSLVVAERIRQSLLDKTIQTDGVKLKVTASLGIASFPEDSLDKKGLVDAADKALYQAKQTGRNKVVSYTKPLFY